MMEPLWAPLWDRITGVSIELRVASWTAQNNQLHIRFVAHPFTSLTADYYRNRSDSKRYDWFKDVITWKLASKEEKVILDRLILSDPLLCQFAEFYGIPNRIEPKEEFWDEES